MFEKLTLLEFLLRLIPETIIFVFASYALCCVKVDLKKLIMASGLLSIGVFLVRMLPITYGVHIILNLIIQTGVIAYICEINIIKLIKSGIIVTILLLLSEGISVFIYTVILKIDLKPIFENDIKKVIYGMPSLIIFASFIGGYYYYLYKGKKLNDV